MSGWPFTVLFCLGIPFLALLAVRPAANGWRGWIAIAIIASLTMPWLARGLFGDVSRYLPPGLFSEGADGKDQIILASVAATIAGAIVLAGLAVAIARSAYRLLRPAGE